MEEIDLVKYEKQLKRKYDFDVLKTKDGMKRLITKSTTLSAKALAISSILAAPNISLSMSAVITTMLSIYLAKQYQSDIYNCNIERKNKIYSEVINKIKESDTYLECLEQYSNYQEKLGSFIESLNIKKPLDVALFYQQLLDNGYLSYNHTHEYENFPKSAKFEVKDLFGCRVVTGKAVCRHMASFLTDLENKLGNDCFSIPITMLNLEEIIKDRDKDLINYPIINHLITGIKEGNFIYGIDPTMQNIINIDDDKYTPVIQNLKFLQPNNIYGTGVNLANSEIKNSNIYILKNSNNMKLPEYKETYEKLFSENTQFKCFHPMEVYIRNIESKFKYNSNIEYIDEFYNETQPQLNSLNELSEQLAPLTHKKVKHLVLK